MPRVTLIFAVLLIILGVIGYLGDSAAASKGPKYGTARSDFHHGGRRSSCNGSKTLNHSPNPCVYRCAAGTIRGTGDRREVAQARNARGSDSWFVGISCCQWASGDRPDETCGRWRREYEKPLLCVRDGGTLRRFRGNVCELIYSGTSRATERAGRDAVIPPLTHACAGVASKTRKAPRVVTSLRRTEDARCRPRTRCASQIPSDITPKPRNATLQSVARRPSIVPVA